MLIFQVLLNFPSLDLIPINNYCPNYDGFQLVICQLQNSFYITQSTFYWKEFSFLIYQYELIFLHFQWVIIHHCFYFGAQIIFDLVGESFCHSFFYPLPFHSPHPHIFWCIPLVFPLQKQARHMYFLIISFLLALCILHFDFFS